MKSHPTAKSIVPHQTLEQLESDFWGEPPVGVSSLVSKCYELRRKRINDFEAGDFRILIGQQIGLPFLVPFAINLLDDNAFIEGDYYEGDLLKSVLTINPEFWKANPELKENITRIFERNKDTLTHEAPIDQKIKAELIEAYSNLLSLR
ncbi:contact-dependent growth inhibition system immunity protein [Dawidia soli]|uniref:Uncharacterized protein n=1 Tax=Dawidia soli TaxID=2782352 RepID=A0AAP2DBY9_9BACT|nr:contact-dependent growth inhibition system immunity protein [Dawidia soli]MBT1689159.1 hypothetical protein [Dawidia soli]